MPKWTSIAWRVGITVLAAAMLSACNLGQPAPSEPIDATQSLLVNPQDIQGQGLAPTATWTAIFQVPPTNTPLPQLLPAETLGPISIDGTAHHTQDPVTVRVRAGVSVSTINCTYLLQDTNQTMPLGTPTTQSIDANINEHVFTFTPQAAGTYQVNCTGIALTVSGQRAVSAAGLPFAVEAKG
jgi:hypothetical protein